MASFWSSVTDNVGKDLDFRDVSLAQLRRRRLARSLPRPVPEAPEPEPDESEPEPEPEPEPDESESEPEPSISSEFGAAERPWNMGSFAIFGGTHLFAARPANVRAQNLFLDIRDNSVDAALARAETIASRCPYAAGSVTPQPWTAACLQQQPLVEADQAPAGPEHSALTLVDSAAAAASMLRTLSSCESIAMDVEQYQQTSYFGFTCTLQFATAAHGNFIVDACEPAVREALQQHLNELTSDPRVLKILHGGKDDVAWLQRDFDAYLVNVIDTQCMAKELDLPLNLKDLVMNVFSIELDKASQQEDWTQRPLPVAMAYYAAADAHYLLALADELQARICTKSADSMRSVQSKSMAVCRDSLWKPRQIGSGNNPWSKDSNFKAAIREFFPHGTITKHPAIEARLKELYLWRDAEARNKDDGVNNVCDKRTLIRRAIAESEAGQPEPQVQVQSEPEPEPEPQPQPQPQVTRGWGAAATSAAVTGPATGGWGSAANEQLCAKKARELEIAAALGIGLECLDKQFAADAAEAFSPADNKRWAALGDRVVEWAVRRHIFCQAMSSDASFDPCSRCSMQMKLLRAGTSADSSDCPYCSKQQQYTSNRALADIARPWMASVLGRWDERGRWKASRAETLSEKQLGTAVEALIGLMAHQFGMEEAVKLYGLKAGLPFAASRQASSGHDIEGLLPKLLETHFGSAAAVSVATVTAQWRRYVFLGEAVTDLRVMHFHFDQNPQADEGDLHNLTRVAEYHSTKQTVLARAAKRAGLGLWADDVQLRSFGATSANQPEADEVISSSECWKAAVGLLVVDCGFQLDDAEKFITRYLLLEVQPQISEKEQSNNTDVEEQSTVSSGWGGSGPSQQTDLEYAKTRTNQELNRQINYYFSDVALMASGDRVMELINDDLARGGVGFVPLQELASFNRIQELLDDTVLPLEQTLRDGLEGSDFLDLSADGLCVRRKTPIPTPADWLAMQDVVENRALEVTLSDPALELALTELRARRPKAKLLVSAREKMEEGVIAALRADAIGQFETALKRLADCRHYLLDKYWGLGQEQFRMEGENPLLYMERRKRRHLLNACRVNSASCELNIVRRMEASRTELELEPEPEPETQPEQDITRRGRSVQERLETARSELERSGLLDELQTRSSRNDHEDDSMEVEAPRVVARFVVALISLAGEHTDQAKTSLRECQRMITNGVDGLADLLVARCDAMVAAHDGVPQVSAGDEVQAGTLAGSEIPVPQDSRDQEDLDSAERQCVGCDDRGEVEVLFTKSQFKRNQPRCKVCVQRRTQAKKVQDVETNRAMCSAAVVAAPLEYVVPTALPTAQNLAHAERELARLEKAANRRERQMFRGIFAAA